MSTTWKENERRAATALGLATAKSGNDHGKVTTWDVELDDGGKLVLTILRSGGLSVQTFRACMSAKSLYRLEGTVTLEPGFIREWAETLFLMTRVESRRGHEVLHRWRGRHRLSDIKIVP